MAGVIAMLDDRHDEASRLFAEASDGAARCGELNVSAYFRALLPCRTGHLADAVSQLREVYAGDGPNPLGPARIALAHAWRGEVSHAQACIEEAREVAAGWPHRAWTEINFAVGFLALLAGDLGNAWAALREAAAQLDAISYREPSHPPVLPAAVEAAAGLGLVDEARTLCTRLERDSAGLGSRFGLAAARGARGFIADAEGDHVGAQSCFAESAATFLDLGVPLEAARGYLALGALLRRGGQRRRAREALDTARAIFLAAGARGLVLDCDVELAKISGRIASGSAELTTSERQVADLVATGMRNADVAAALHLSTKTVETHLGRVFRKLGVANRTELSTTLTPSAHG
jgi:DNA-binding CsgD family transcriptional regulator